MKMSRDVTNPAMLTRGGERERAGNRGIIMELQQLAVEISLAHTQNHLIIIQSATLLRLDIKPKCGCGGSDQGHWIQNG